MDKEASFKSKSHLNADLFSRLSDQSSSCLREVSEDPLV